MNTIFTVEESNLISIFASENRTKVIQDISNAIPHLDDGKMIELSLRAVSCFFLMHVNILKTKSKTIVYKICKKCCKKACGNWQSIP